MYADDITLFLNDENGMHHALNVICEFSVFSGLEVNKTKSHAMWLGSNKTCTDTFFGFNWKGKLEILGVYFFNFKCASHIDENWSERIVKIKRLILIWEKCCWKNMYY